MDEDYRLPVYDASTFINLDHAEFPEALERAIKNVLSQDDQIISAFQSAVL